MVNDLSSRPTHGKLITQVDDTHWMNVHSAVSSDNYVYIEDQEGFDALAYTGSGFDPHCNKNIN